MAARLCNLLLAAHTLELALLAPCNALLFPQLPPSQGCSVVSHVLFLGSHRGAGVKPLLVHTVPLQCAKPLVGVGTKLAHRYLRACATSQVWC